MKTIDYCKRTVLLGFALMLCVTVSGCIAPKNRLGMTDNVMHSKTEVVEVNGEKISYRSFGTGAPLLLLQRFRGSLNDWDPELLTALSVSNRVITFDSIGVADSEGQIPETLEGAADFVVAFMDALKIQRANVLGWSLGGMTAQVLAIKHPDRVEKLILAGTTPPAGSDEVQFAPDEWTSIATKPENSAADMAYLFYTTTDSGLRAALESQQRFERLYERGVRTKTSASIIMPQAIAARGFIDNRGNWYQRLTHIERPVLIANGDSDLAFPVINSIVLHREIPDSKLVIYPDAGHAFLFQYASRFSVDVNNFLGNE